MVLRRIAVARPADISRPAAPVRPTVTILIPTDLATIPVGSLRIRGTVSATGEKVRVLVNGVRAIVQSGTFTASVRVTPHTLILSATATTRKGLTARHQIGVAVSEARENAFRLRPFPGHGPAPLATRFPLLASVMPSRVQEDLGDGGWEDPPAAHRDNPRFTFGRVISPYPPASAMTAVDSGEAMSLVLVPAGLDGRRSAMGPGLPEKRLRADAEATRSVLAMDGGREYRAESTTPRGRGSSAPTLAGIGSPSSRPSRDGEIEQNPRGMPLGPEYSFGVIFTFDAGGYWRVRWY